MNRKANLYLYVILLFIIVTSLTSGTVGKLKFFDCPSIITSDILIQPTDCGKSSGGIFRIRGVGSGIHTYTWYDANNKIVGTDSTLLNMPAGKYTVQMHDESKCNPVIAGPFTITTNTGIFIDERGLTITPATCSNNDGSITGLKVSGAVSYKWVGNDTTKVMATTVDLVHAPLGIYTLKTYNSNGCETDSRAYLVNTNTVLPAIITDTVTDVTCNDADGYIAIRLQVGRNVSAGGFYLIAPSGTYAAYGKLLFTGNDLIIRGIGLGPGTYTLMVGDPLVCAITLKTYTVKQTVFAIDTSKLVVYNDQCGQHTGVIGPVDVIGGTPSVPGQPIKQQYTWTDDKGRFVGSARHAIRLGAGRYKVHVEDVKKCSADSRYYTVGDITSGIKPPFVNSNKLCLPGEEIMTVQNLIPNGLYKLYQLNNLGDTVFLAQSSSGRFMRAISQTTTFFVTTNDGSCESMKKKVIAIVEEPGVNIPSVFSPNHDGVNDYWNISGLSNYPGTLVKVYNRYGQQVYNSVGYGQPFDGMLNGKELPTGTYFYTVDLKKKDCGANSGSVTIVR